jgi:hypothetical protein
MLLPHMPGSSVLDGHHQAAVEIAADRVLADRSRNTGRDIGQRTHLQRYPRRREALEQGGILLGAQAMADPLGVQGVQRAADTAGAGRFSGFPVSKVSSRFRIRR